MKYNQKPSYILPLILILISGIMALVSLLMVRSNLFAPFASTMVNKQQARMLALSGGQIAISQLVKPFIVKDEKKDKPEPTKNTDSSILLLTQILPILNRWQEFHLKKSIDGINGTIKIAISSEQGKIPINKLYDFKQHKFRVKTQQIQGKSVVQADWRSLLQLFFDRIQSQMHIQGNLFNELELFLKKREQPLTDITELMHIPAFAPFNKYQFYEPNSPAYPLYLTDIFSTLSEGAPTIEPWLFSDSMLGLLNIERAKINDISNRTKIIQEILKQFKPSANWNTDWTIRLQPLYKKETKELPSQFTEFLTPTFDPTTFSVISYGTVNGITERLYLIIEKKQENNNKKITTSFIIKKLYWI